jgi:mannose-6-phosphate isomerase-like protein (cupin superfamily)
MQLNVEQAIAELSVAKQPFLQMFAHGSLSVEMYKPDKVDSQKPHDRDEVYVIAAGSGEFVNDGKRMHFVVGDFLFVPAGIEHRFENFTDDFATWVIFYGPVCGEAKD